MEGAAIRERKSLNLAIITAWHTAVFALNGYGGKLKGLSNYLASEQESQPVSTAAQAVAFFRNMKEAGFPVEIKRVVH